MADRKSNPTPTTEPLDDRELDTLAFAIETVVDHVATYRHRDGGQMYDDRRIGRMLANEDALARLGPRALAELRRLRATGGTFVELVTGRTFDRATEAELDAVRCSTLFADCTCAPCRVVNELRRLRAAPVTVAHRDAKPGNVTLPAGAALPPGAVEWLRTGERGVSSEAIFGHLTGIPIGGRWITTYPCDSGDLRRCRLLLEAVPAFAARIAEMANVSPTWARLVEHWAELCALMDEEIPRWRESYGQAPRTYALMQRLIAGKTGA